jgi:iron complex outermembrane receptor protein
MHNRSYHILILFPMVFACCCVFLTSDGILSAQNQPAQPQQTQQLTQNPEQNQNGAANSSGLASKSLEELMNIEVTSVSKKEQKLSQTPAAIYVITQEDIARSGATNIPDLLRMVPGVDVAQVDANRWAISIRGFNDIYSNKLLVLIDGRTAYDPIFSGVSWDEMDVPLNDIERIEIIRGPGGTVWGANAVNGVINIITKSARETQGLYLQTGTGSEENNDHEAQYGGRIGSKDYYRAFGRYFSFGALSNAQNENAADGWLMRHGGFRSDWNLSGKDSLMVEGDLYQTNEGQTIRTPLSTQGFAFRIFNDQFNSTGGSVLSRWDHTFSGGSETSLQFYEMGHTRGDNGARERFNIVDLSFEHHFHVGSRHDLVWGLDYRYNHGSMRAGYAVSMSPPVRNFNLFSGFVQDQIRLTDSLWFTLGSKLEHNPFTGVEDEPSASLAWAIDDHQTLWMAASKAIRQPALLDEAFRIDNTPFALPSGELGVISIFGNPDFRSEQLRDYEIGYWSVLSNKVSVDLDGFYSFYRDLRTNEPQTPFFEFSPPPPHLTLPLIWMNGMRGQDYGAEFSANWRVVPRWKLSGGYSLLKMNLHLNPTSQDVSSLAEEGQSPEHQFNIRSYLNITHNWFFDNSLYFVGRLPAYQVPSYFRLDSRLAWRPMRSLELSVTGQNLLSPRRFEFGNVDQVVATQPERGVVGRITWSFPGL